jgi:ubiquinone/menaquinone biosynthesis C-methylase UbiE
MSKRSNSDYLLKNQYKDDSNLNARGNLHARFRTNPVPWFQWVFDHFILPPDGVILELGCGPAGLWTENLNRTPSTWKITLSDFSPGMLQAAQKNLAQAVPRFDFKLINAQNIPYPDQHFDAVIANHMLFHVPDRKRAIAEIFRVLKPAGRFFAATNGQGHMNEIFELCLQWMPYFAEYSTNNFGVNEFTLENGKDQLKPPFTEVRIEHYEDALKVTEANPLVAYILSMASLDLSQANAETLDAFKKFIEEKISTEGSIHISKSTVLFVATKT